MKKHHDHGNSYKGKHLIGAGLQFRDLVHYHHGGKHGSMQADMVLEKELRVLHIDLQAIGEAVTLGLARACETSKLASTVTHFLQQGHTP